MGVDCTVNERPDCQGEIVSDIEPNNVHDKNFFID